MQFNLDHYRTQRINSQKKRNQLILKFESLRFKNNIKNQHRSQIQQNQVPIPQINQQQPSNSNAFDQQYQLLVKQNHNIKNQLSQSQVNSVNKMKSMKQQIATLKAHYVSQMEKITELERLEKSGHHNKINLLITQIKEAEKKNIQLESSNKLLEQDFKNNQNQLENMLTQIKKQYEQKLKEFETIMNDSKQKIEQMEIGINQQQLVKNALKNPKLIQTLIENSQLNIDATGSKQQFKEILAAKNDIILNLSKNNKMKEIEIKKIKQLTQKFKTVFQSLNAQKKQIIVQNQKMTSELIQIKKIFDVALGNPPQQQQQQQQQQEQEQEENPNQPD